MKPLDDTTLHRPARHVRPEVRRRDVRSLRDGLNAHAGEQGGEWRRALERERERRRRMTDAELAEERERMRRESQADDAKFESMAEAEKAQTRRERMLRKAAIPPTWQGASFADLDRDDRGDAIAAAERWASGELRGLLLWGDVGRGKAQPLDAQVLTPTGWREMGALAVGDAVIGADGRATTVLDVYPQGVRPAFRVTFGDGSTAECDAEHLWHVSDSAGRSRVLTLAEIRRSLRTTFGHARWKVPLVAPVEFADAGSRPLDPYLLGVLLGDGCLRARSVSVSTADIEIRDAVGARLPAGVTMKHRSAYDYDITAGRTGGKPQPLLEALRGLGLAPSRSEHKFVPEAYLLAPPAARLELLRGLLDTDGYAEPGGSRVEFVTVSRQLARDVQFIVRSLGGRATIAEKPTTGQLAYRLNLAFPVGMQPFALARKIARFKQRERGNPCRYIVAVDEIGEKPMQCIRVAARDSLYVTDDFTVTHNTRVAATAALERIRVGPLRWLNVADLVMDLRGGFSSPRYEDARRMLVPVAGCALVLDDLDKLKPTDHAVQPIYLAINSFVEAELPLLVTLNRDLDELAADFGERFGEAVSSRLAGYCEQYEVAGRDRRLQP